MFLPRKYLEKERKMEENDFFYNTKNMKKIKYD